MALNVSAKVGHRSRYLEQQLTGKQNRDLCCSCVPGVVGSDGAECEAEQTRPADSRAVFKGVKRLTGGEQ